MSGSGGGLGGGPEGVVLLQPFANRTVYADVGTYDDLGRMTNSADPNQHHTWFAYDAAGQLTFTTNALNQTVQFHYELVGNRTFTASSSWNGS